MMKIEGKTYYNWRDLPEIVGRTGKTIHLLRKKSFFPEPDLKPGGTSAFWSADTLKQWLEVTEPALIADGLIYRQRERKNKKRTHGQSDS